VGCKLQLQQLEESWPSTREGTLAGFLKHGLGVSGGGWRGLPMSSLGLVCTYVKYVRGETTHILVQTHTHTKHQHTNHQHTNIPHTHQHTNYTDTQTHKCVKHTTGQVKHTNVSTHKCVKHTTVLNTNTKMCQTHKCVKHTNVSHKCVKHTNTPTHNALLESGVTTP
jgi:hypothetical protein